MMGTHLGTKGGIASVIKVYQAAGLLTRYPIEYVATHRDGCAAAKLGIMLRAYLRFVTLLLSGQVGLLHLHVASRASFWRKTGFAALASLFRVPYILHLHGAEFAQFFEQECGPGRQRLVRTVFDRAARVIVLSDTWARWVRSMTSNPHVEAIYNPVLVPSSPPPWQQRQAGNVLFLGRIGDRKGSFDLLEAAARVLPACPQLSLQFGGDGELERAAAHAAELGLGAHFSLLGWVGAPERETCLRQAALYTLPSYNEGLPMSVLEAMAAGLPVLSTPVGGIPEAVTDGVEGYLVPPGNVGELACRLQELLLAPELAAKMGAAARRKVETTFSAEAILPKVERVYLDMGFLPQ